MLSKGEEERLQFLLETANIKKDVSGMLINPTAYARTYQWLLDKLNEEHTELVEVVKVLEKSTEKFNQIAETLSKNLYKL